MKNEFDKWNTEKQKLDAEEYSKENFPQIGEVWMSVIGKNIGYEQNGTGDNFSRPVAIVSRFNNKMFWVAPLSTKQKEFDFYYNFLDPNNQKVSIIIAQLKLVSLKRLKRKMYDLSEKDFNATLQRIKSFLKNRNPAKWRDSSSPSQGTL